MVRNEIIIGDVLDSATWSAIPDASVQCVVTSPPYWGLRDYGTATWEGGDAECDHCVDGFTTVVSDKQASNAASGSKQARDVCPKCGAKRIDAQLGLEATPEEYVEKMVAVFRHVRRVLRDDGALWLNLGDSYNGYMANQRATSISARNQSARPNFKSGHGPRTRGLKPKDLVGVPWRVAFALQADGWYLRQDIIWHKPNPMPESCRDRCTKAHEYIFLLTQKPRYFCDMEAVKDVAQTGGNIDAPATGKANKRSVWTIPREAYPEAHFATFPQKLVEPCILAGTSAKGCCPECGAPWRRVVESEKHFLSGSGQSGKKIAGKHGPKCQGGGNTGDIRRGPVIESRTTGWEASCECETDGPCPCIVLDPFLGSGTTAAVAAVYGRDWIGIELKPEYADQARDRIGKATVAGYVVQDTPEDAPLFNESLADDLDRRAPLTTAGGHAVRR